MHYQVLLIRLCFQYFYFSGFRGYWSYSCYLWVCAGIKGVRMKTHNKNINDRQQAGWTAKSFAFSCPL
jgi:hypothetical protein